VGGMATKLQAADVARRAGVDVVIAAGRLADVICRVADGERLGTRFPAVSEPLESRKRWIFAGRTPRGRLVIDAGAAHALTDAGRSLLPAGITAVEGDFARGDTVSILNPEREELARGITRYGSQEIAALLGAHSHEIASRLGYDNGSVAVHRNDLILV
jgi:glutamate 5-kinase